jgi:subtilase-type serine protease
MLAALALSLVACGQSGATRDAATDGGGSAVDSAGSGGGAGAIDSADSGGSGKVDSADSGGSGTVDSAGSGGSGTVDGADSGDITGGSLPAGKLVLDIAGTTQGVDYAFLKVAGKAMLGGELHLTFATGFVPKSGQNFIVVSTAGGVSGTFASVTTNGVPVTPGHDATTFYVTVN